ncbi:MAG: DNA helicase UvrD [Candidatus Aenigmarchaeota archaeon]|nr:DNA helicase UvrD [Candidatus Aenigmarchaeota archaeon]
MGLIFADLHIHSKYSRATSNRMDIKGISEGAKIKGLDLIGTGDMAHPLWFKELKENLVESSYEGIYEHDNILYILSNEISLMYTQNKRGRKVHNVILAPSFEVAEQVNDWLKTRGRVDYDGRPIFGFTCPELVENLINISKDIMIIPAHIWTPFFGCLGSKSGFDSVEECFQDQTKHIHALETGLSSNPSMNWRLSNLDKFTLVSFSDSHSPWPWRLGRECCVFDIENLSYRNIMDAIKSKDKGKFPFTLEFFPEEGKYHYDGHRNCNFSCSPKEAERLKDMCPVCKKPLTIGVLHRVEELADRPEGFRPEGAIPYKSLIPLSEIISSVLGIDQLYSKKIWDVYNKLIKAFGSEFRILLKTPESELKTVNERVADAIIRVRDGKVKIVPGYDGVYGSPVFNGGDRVNMSKSVKRQKSLVDFG